MCDMDRSFRINLEAHDESSSDEHSSCGLQIDISESELGEDTVKEPKRKRKCLKKSDGNNRGSMGAEKNEDEDDGLPRILSTMEQEIERQLDSKAAKSKLSVANVKNILKSVITNEHVLAMVRHTMKGKDGDTDLSQAIPFEPKLTRARTRELMMTLPSAAWPMSPLKKMPSSECQVLIEQELPEDSSDEEYRPNDNLEQSEEDKENESAMSDAESQPPTPMSTSERPTINDCATQTSWSDDDLFRKPEENIGQRTRSKLSLSDTPLETIERAFIPPDITTDMYDSECDDEDWKNFLKDFTEPLLTDVNDALDDDEADPEYNVLADEEQEIVDKEELRVDRAVMVSKKELNALMAELFEYADMMSSDEEAPRQERDVEVTDSMQCPLKGESLEGTGEAHGLLDESMTFTLSQRLLLDQHMRKHVQLLTQHFLQTYKHPLLHEHAATCKGDLVSLKYLADNKDNSAFDAANLHAAIELIEEWERYLSVPEHSGQYTNFLREEIRKGQEEKKKRRLHNYMFHPKLMDRMVSSPVFLYPLLLPDRPFQCNSVTQLLYVPSEDELVAIGLEQFMQFGQMNPTLFPKKLTIPQVLPYITSYMMPMKDAKRLYFHIRKCSRIKGNPIKHYLEHGTSPSTQHYVIPFNKELVKAPQEQPLILLPHVWRQHILGTAYAQSHAKNVHP